MGMFSTRLLLGSFFNLMTRTPTKRSSSEDRPLKQIYSSGFSPQITSAHRQYVELRKFVYFNIFTFHVFLSCSLSFCHA